MSNTSIGSVIIGLLAVILGVGLVVAGTAAALEFGFASGSAEEEHHGPFGVFGHEKEASGHVEPAGILGATMAVVGVLVVVLGLLHTGRSLERGKDRDITLRSIERDG